MKVRPLCIGLAVGLFVGVAPAADELTIVSLCRDGHLQARAAIRQLRCDLEVRIAPEQMLNPYTGKLEDRPAQTQRFSWWEDQDVARCIGTFGGLTEDFLWKDETLKLLEPARAQRAGKRISPTGRLDGPSGIKHVQTAWHAALFYRPDDLRELMRPQNLVAAIEAVEGGQRLYKVTVNHSAVYREDIFFDPRHNYAVKKRVGYPNLQDLSAQHVQEVVGFTEPKPGVYFPERVQSHGVYKGKTDSRMVTVFTNVRVNDPIDPNKLQLRFPAGTQVTDTRSGKTYKVGEDEQPVGAVKAMAKPRNLGGDKLYPTALQPGTPWRQVVLWGAAGITALMLAVVVVRRRRSVGGVN